jgi:hypothetical protein
MKRGLLLRNLLNRNSNAKGKLGEMLAIQGMRRYASVKNTSRLGYSGDANLSGTSIEIKTATVNKRGEYRVCLIKNDRYGYADFRVSAYVLIQLINDSGKITLYLIPTIILLGQKNICMSANSRKYKAYKQDSYKTVTNVILQ